MEDNSQTVEAPPTTEHIAQDVRIPDSTVLSAAERLQAAAGDMFKNIGEYFRGEMQGLTDVLHNSYIKLPTVTMRCYQR